MNARWTAYQIALNLLPKPRLDSGDAALDKLLIRHRAQGATAVRFDDHAVTRVYACGRARMDGTPAAADTVYRAASVTKLATAMCALRLIARGTLPEDCDVGETLGVPLRNPLNKNADITPRMLLTHTSSIVDGAAYAYALASGAALCDVLTREGVYGDWLPGEKHAYSNFGMGILGCLLEKVTGQDIETLMQTEVFAPLGMRATMLARRAGRALADAWHVLPPASKPSFDAERRLSEPDVPMRPDPDHHYTYAQSAMNADAASVARLGMALLSPDFLGEDTQRAMCAPAAAFGARDPHLEQGMGVFIFRDDAVCPRPLYGHQGLAYGAAHMVFADPGSHRGVALLTSAISLKRSGVLTDANRDVLRWAFA